MDGLKEGKKKRPTRCSRIKLCRSKKGGKIGLSRKKIPSRKISAGEPLLRMMEEGKKRGGKVSQKKGGSKRCKLFFLTREKGEKKEYDINSPSGRGGGDKGLEEGENPAFYPTSRRGKSGGKGGKGCFCLSFYYKGGEKSCGGDTKGECVSNYFLRELTRRRNS